MEETGVRWGIPVFYRIGNCAKNRAVSTVRFRVIELFGSGSGHCPLFCFLGLTIHNEVTIMRTNVCIFANIKERREKRNGVFLCDEDEGGM